MSRHRSEDAAIRHATRRARETGRPWLVYRDPSDDGRDYDAGPESPEIESWHQGADPVAWVGPDGEIDA